MLEGTIIGIGAKGTQSILEFLKGGNDDEESLDVDGPAAVDLRTLTIPARITITIVNNDVTCIANI